MQGRTVPGKSSAELLHRAHQQRMQLRAAQAIGRGNATPNINTSAQWTPLGPAPAASQNGGANQDYGPVTGRVSAVVVDQTDLTGKTVYIGGAYGGVWRSTDAGNTWTALTDDQLTLAVGAIALQPGNSNVILAGTGEPVSASSAYYGQGILRSTDNGATWILVPSSIDGHSFRGMGFSEIVFHPVNTSLVVAAVSNTSQGGLDGAKINGAQPGIYFSTDAGTTWQLANVSDGSIATNPGSVSSVVFDAAARAGAGVWLAAYRAHGIYSSTDGMNWRRLPDLNQPLNGLSLANCPTGTSSLFTCPLYRGELSVLPGRDEIYAWIVDVNSADQGIYQSLNGGLNWTQLDETGITNCGDPDFGDGSSSCGTRQGTYNLYIKGVPDGQATDLYAGSINIYRCNLTAANPTCASAPFQNLTHAYGCVPVAGVSHVHPDQHAMDFSVASPNMIYFGNDGGVYGTTQGVALTNGSCSGPNLFLNLNQNMGSLNQMNWFSQDPANSAIVLGGSQDNGSPATASAGSTLNWFASNNGDGGYNIINPSTSSEWFTSHFNISVARCTAGASCNPNGSYSTVVSQAQLGGETSAFYPPFMLDPNASGNLILGSCRVWRGPSTGGWTASANAISPDFNSPAGRSCTTSTPTFIVALAAGGTGSPSPVIYAGTQGYPAPTNLGGRLMVTTNANAAAPAWTDVTPPINNAAPGPFSVSSIAIDATDKTGATAYATIMGFTGGGGHVWKTTSFGAAWTDITGNLPDAPVDSTVIDPDNSSVVYVGTDVGVFVTSNPVSNATWTEVNPTSEPGMLPNVAVTHLAFFRSGTTKLLRASTFGRGLWQYDLGSAAIPDYALSISNSPLTAFPSQTVAFMGTLTAINGYNSLVNLACASGPVSLTCTSPAAVTPTNAGVPFSVSVSNNAAGIVNFSIAATGTDAGALAHSQPVTLQVVDFTLALNPASVTVAPGSQSPLVSATLTSVNGFTGNVSLSCNPPASPAGITCSAPGAVTVPASGSAGATTLITVGSSVPNGFYNVTITATGPTGSTAKVQTLTVNVQNIPDFTVTSSAALVSKPGQVVTASNAIALAALNGFSGKVNLACAPNFVASGMICATNPASAAAFPATASLTMDSSKSTGLVAGSYSFSVSGTSGTITHSINLPYTVIDYTVSAASISALPTTTATIAVTISPATSAGYNGNVNVNCSVAGQPAIVCNINSPVTLNGTSTVGANATFAVPAGAPGDYTVNINTSDAALPALVHNTSATVSVGSYQVSAVSGGGSTLPGGTSANQIGMTLTSQNGYSGSIVVACDARTSLGAGATCSLNPPGPIALSPSAPVSVMATVAVPQGTAPGNYAVSFSSSDAHVTSLAQSLPVPFGVSGFSLVAPTAAGTVPGGAASGTATLSPLFGYSGSVTSRCDVSAIAGATCTLTPGTPIPLSSGSGPLTVNVTVPASTVVGTYSAVITSSDSIISSYSHTGNFTVGIQDYSAALTSLSATGAPGATVQLPLTLTPVNGYNRKVGLKCDTSHFAGASCSFTPPSPVSVSGTTAVTANLTIAGSTQAGTYSVVVNTSDFLVPGLTHNTAAATVSLSDFQLPPDGSLSATVPAGQPASFTIPITATTGFSGAIVFTCAIGLPPLSSCPAVTAPAGAPSAVVLITTTHRSLARVRSAASSYAMWLMAPGLFLIVAGASRRKKILPLIGLCLIFSALAGCGGGGSSSSPSLAGQTGTPAGTYSVVIQGSAGADIKTTKVTLVVN